VIVYSAVNKINGKRYVGITRGTIAARMRGHLGRGHTYFQNALRAYGIQSFDISVLDTADDWKVLCEKEKYWIAELKCIYPNGYNLTAGGEGIGDFNSGKPLSVEHKRNIGLGLLGRVVSRETGFKISLAKKGRGNGWTGRHLSPAHRAKLSASSMGKPGTMKGRKFSAAHRAKISDALKQRHAGWVN
jgi:group I intron endonuclease